MVKKIIYEGKYLRYVIEDQWEYSERVINHEVVIIIAITADDEFLLVEQFRPPVGKNVIELTAGLIGDVHEDETAEESAHKELIEETGYKAERMELLIQAPICAGLCDEVGNFYFAHNISKVGEGGGDETEDITVHKIPMNEIEDWLANKHSQGIYIDPKIYTGLYFARKKLAA